MIEVKGIDCIANYSSRDGKEPLKLDVLVKQSPIKVIDFNIDSYDAGFDILQENGNVIKIRVSTMPSADTSFYIEQ